MRVFNPALAALFFVALLGGIRADEDVSDEDDDFIGMIKTECEKNGGPTAFANLTEEVMVFKNLVDAWFTETTSVQPETTTKSDEDEDIGDYCKQIPVLEMYLKNIAEAFKPCVKLEEREEVDALYNVTNSILDFVCYNGGENLALFAIGSGFECVAANEKAIDTCSQEAFGSYFEFNSTEDSLTIDAQSCIDVKKFQDCFVNVLKGCDDQTAANMMESMFNSVLEVTPCEKLLNESSPLIKKEISMPKSGKPYGSFKEKCDANGGPMAYNVAMESIEFFEITFRHLVSQPSREKMTPIDAKFDVKWMELAVKMQCHRAPIVKELANYLVRSVRPCHEAEEWEFLETIYNVTSTSLDFVCHNDGERIYTFLTPNETKFSQPDTTIFLPCLKHAFSPDEFVPLDTTQLLTTFDKPLTVDPQTCAKLYKFERCGVKALTRYDRRESAELLESWLDSVAGALFCERPEEPKRTPNAEAFTELIFSFDNETTSPERVDQLFKENCLKYGGPSAYEAMKEIGEVISNGIEALQESFAEPDTEVNGTRLEDDPELLFANLCQEVPAMGTFVEHLAEALKNCVEPDYRESIETAYKTVNATLEFMCKNEGEPLMNFFTHDGLECLASKKEALDVCVTEFSETHIATTGLFVPGREECIGVKTAERCIVKAMETCEDKLPAKTVDDFLNFVSKVTPCHQFYEEETLATTSEP